MKWIAMVLAIVCAGAAWAGEFGKNWQFLTWEGPYRVTRVVDGDTWVLNIKGSDTKVRLNGVDTPEIDGKGMECPPQAGEVAKMVAENYVRQNSGVVWIAVDSERNDKYGRLLAWVAKRPLKTDENPHEVVINILLASSGAARPFIFGFNLAFAEGVINGAVWARAQGLGIWAPGYCFNDTKRKMLVGTAWKPK